jgi:hypothetical protein
MPLMDFRSITIAAVAAIGVALIMAPASAAPSDRKDFPGSQRSLERVEPGRTAQSQPRAVQPQSSRSGGQRGDHSGNRSGGQHRGNRSGGRRSGDHSGNRSGGQQRGNRSGGRRSGDHSGNRSGGQQRGNRSGGRRSGDHSGNRSGGQQRGNRSGGRRSGDHSGNRSGGEHRGNRSGGRRHDSYRGGRRHNSYSGGHRRRDHRRADRRHYRSGAYRHPAGNYGGRSYGHGYGPRGGHGYFCSYHNIFHYNSGYNPIGWGYASFGWDLYSSSYIGNCQVVSQTFYRRGARYEDVALLCYDAYGYGYIKPGSRRVYRTY